MVDYGPLGSESIMVWRVLQFVMQWWQSEEVAEAVLLLDVPQEIRESNDFGGMFLDVFAICSITHFMQWSKQGYWTQRTQFTC